jgi:hypothetical protein
MRTRVRCGSWVVIFALTALSTLGCGGGDEAGGATAGSGGTGGGTGGSGGSSGTGTGGDGGSSGTGTGGAGGTGGGGVPGYDIHAADRKACTFTSGSTTTQTVGPDVPHGDALPFEHIVVLMMENRSFDHYFSKLPEYGVTDVDVADDTYTNLDPDANPPSPVQRFHETRYCTLDVNHEWEGVHQQYNGDGRLRCDE